VQLEGVVMDMRSLLLSCYVRIELAPSNWFSAKKCLLNLSL
jgi:hypothetical protein